MIALATLLALAVGGIRTYPAPAGEPLSKAFSVRVEGKPCPVYRAKVGTRDRERRDWGIADFRRSAEVYDLASFSSFDMEGKAKVTVSCPETIKSVRVLPTSAGVVAKIEGKRLSFRVDRPQSLTIEVNGDWSGSLHLFANPIEQDVPNPSDPNVLYFGPGIHEITHLVVPDGKTLYVAGGAILRCTVGKDEKGWVDGDGVHGYPASIELLGKHVALRGRGIIDAERCPTHSRNILFVKGQDATVEGVVLRDSPTWNMPIRQSDRVTVRNVKIFGHRANTDGIDICNSRDVLVEDCFLRTLDDLIVVKSDAGQGEVRHVVARRCVLWNPLAHALSVGAELRDPIDDVTFEDCDVIHDIGREWTMRIFHCDSAPVTNVRFQNIRVEETQRLLSVWIGETSWTRQRERGQIRNVLVKAIKVAGTKPKMEVLGFDAGHVVDNATLDDVTVNGHPIVAADVQKNAFVRNLVVRP